MERMSLEDVTAPEYIEIVIHNDGKVIWINNEGRCLFRACQIKQLVLDDRRKAPSVFSKLVKRFRRGTQKRKQCKREECPLET